MDTHEATPKKYIRTFASDLQTFQAGGTPELVPLEGQLPVPTESRVEAPAAAPQPPLPAVPVSAAQPVVPEEKEPVPTPIKTYTDDFRERMKETGASTLTVLASEQDAASHPEAAEAPANVSRWKNNAPVVAGALLILVGGVGAYIAFSYYQRANVLVTPATVSSAPIFVDESEDVSGTGVKLVQAIEQSARKPLVPDTLRLLRFTDASAATSVFAALAPKAPGVLLRNIRGAGSIAGIVNAGGAQAPFFLLSVDSYSATFSGMLSWEPVMLGDLGVFFPAYPAPVASSTTATTTSTVATTTVTTVRNQERGGFRDEVVSNHDVRVYRDASGRSIMLYGYWNESTLVIARDPAAFAEILGRLATTRTGR